MKKYGSIDYAIDQWIHGMLYNGKNKGYTSAYNSLVELGGMESIPTADSIEQEKNLISSIRNSGMFNLHEQTAGTNGTTVFYHIRKGAYAPNIPYRIYLNCRATSTPALARAFINNMSDMPDYYFKINSQEQSRNFARSEQFVFYIKDANQLNEIINRIRATKANYPQLFIDSNNINPFLRNIDGYIGYAPQPDSGIYNELNGQSKTIAKSYNSLLSAALEDSLQHSLNAMVAQNPSLVKAMQWHNGTNYQTELIDKITDDSKLRTELINQMKWNLSIASSNNSELAIKGINEKNNNIINESTKNYNARTQEAQYR